MYMDYQVPLVCATEPSYSNSKSVALCFGKYGYCFLDKDYCYCKITSLGSLKVRIRTKKQKDVIHDGICFSRRVLSLFSASFTGKGLPA